MGKTSSAVWQYFTPPNHADAPKQVVCKVLMNGNECGRQLTKQSAWNAKRHLRDIHGIDLFAIDEQRRQAAPTKISRLKLDIRNAREERSRLRAECRLSRPPMTPCQDEILPTYSTAERSSSSGSLPLTERRKEQNRKSIQKHRRFEKMLEQTLQRIRNENVHLKASCGATTSRAQPSQTTSSDLPSSAKDRWLSTEMNGSFGALRDRRRGSSLSNRASPITLALYGQQSELATVPLEWVDELFQMWDTHNADLRPISQQDDPLIPFVCRYKELFTAKMQCANPPLDHAFREVQSWYSAGMTDYPVSMRSHAKLRGCFVLDLERDFLRNLMQNISVWTGLVALKSAIAVQSSDERGILQLLYCILCRTAAALFDDSTQHICDDDDYLTLGGGNTRLGRRRITDADRDYFYSPLGYDKSMMDSLTGKITRDTNTHMLGDVVSDVFSFTLSGTLNFNFYEECATILPSLREAFKQCVHQLPREHVEKAWMSRAVVQYQRTRPFTGACYHQRFIIESHWCSGYRARKHPLTLKRYAIDTLHLKFSNRNIKLPHLTHLDVVCPEFLSYMSNVRAQHMELSGFHGAHMAEAIDKTTFCASHAEYVQCICFTTNSIEQIQAVLENGRELPKTAQNLCISMATVQTRPVPGLRLNPKRRGPSEPMFLPHGFLSGYEVARMIEGNSSILRRITLDGRVHVDIELLRSVRVVDVLSAVEDLFKMFMTKSIVPRMKLTIENAENDIKQLMLFGLTNGFMAKSDSLGKNYADLTMGKLRDDGLAYEVRIFEKSDDEVRAVIGVGEPVKKSKEHHSDYWNHSHCMDFELDYGIKA